MKKNEVKFFNAVKANDIKKVKSMLRSSFFGMKKVDVNVQNERDATALMRAAGWSSFEMIELLIAHGADPNLSSYLHGTALGMAIENCDSPVSIFLIENGADYNQICVEDSGANHLMVAVFHNNVEIVKYLLNKGMDINQKDSEGKTVLMWATQVGSSASLEMIDLLIENGANIRSRDNEGRTILDHLHQIYTAFEVRNHLEELYKETPISEEESNDEADVTKEISGGVLMGNGWLPGAYLIEEAITRGAFSNHPKSIKVLEGPSEIDRTIASHVYLKVAKENGWNDQEGTVQLQSFNMDSGRVLWAVWMD